MTKNRWWKCVRTDINKCIVLHRTVVPLEEEEEEEGGMMMMMMMMMMIDTKLEKWSTHT